MLELSIVSGPVRVLLLLVGPLALLALLTRRGQPGWWTRRVPLALGAGVLAAGLLVLVVQVLWRPFPDPLPRPVVLWTGLTVAALALAVRRGGRPWTAALALAAVGVVALTGAAQVNQQFQAYPTVRSALGLRLPAQVPWAQVPPRQRNVVRAPVAGVLSDVWQPDVAQRRASVPAAGILSTVDIPGRRSGFRARAAWVYLPPAYLRTPRPLLPVLVLLAGQPGAPRDWVDGGQVNLVLDRYAAAHDGLAPVVVVPDVLGSRFANPLCVDSPAGNAFSYLTRDVPAWIDATLQVDPDRTAWAVGGVSAGATCALQLAVAVPKTFPTALVLSGQREPTLGDRSQTVRERFNGSEAAFRAANPLDELRARRLPGSAVVVAVGQQDAPYQPQAEELAAALRSAGTTVRRATAPGGHSWGVWRSVLAQELPWLGGRLRLTRPSSG